MNSDEERDARAAAVAEVRTRLRARGIIVTGSDTPEELVDLQSAVENFEKTVEAHGGDLMVDDLKSSLPDDPHFVLPRRAPGEGVRPYIGRIDDAEEHLRHHPRRPG
jgi:hypothetical protein